MPISPENKKRYPANWLEVRWGILKRARSRCEFCGVKNYAWVKRSDPERVIKIILTIAHLDHQPENCDPENLKALCQRCHCRYDRKHRQGNARRTRREKAGQLEMGL